MELRIFTEPQQGATYDDLVTVAQEAERLGFGAFFRSDHYLSMGPGSGEPGPSDAWITLAGIARETSSIRLGTLVTSATFRHPGPLAVAVANVDQMSAGRVDFGLGAGWFVQEHEAYGIPFPDTGERFDRLEEQLELITGLWAADGRYSFAGKHYTLTDSPALPKPVQRSGHRGTIPVVVGGLGPKRTPALAAAYADEFNAPFASLGDTRRQFERVARAVEQAGRAPESMLYGAAQVLCVGEDEAEVERRAAAIGREKDELRANGLAGTPEEVLAKIGAYAEAGAERLYLQVLDLHDLDHLRLVARDVLAAL
jgi:F420-dependent oxidoreductase-like protein